MRMYFFRIFKTSGLFFRSISQAVASREASRNLFVISAF